MVALFILGAGEPLHGQEASPEPVGEVVRIAFASRAELQNLAAQVDVWEVHRDGPGVDAGYLVALVTPEQRRFLQTFGYALTIDAVRTAEIQRNARSPGDLTSIPDFACYRTVEETYADLAQLAADHPNLARWIDFGDTYDKATAGGPEGYDLNALVLTNWASTAVKGRLVVMAALHARELATAELATRFAELLVSQYGVDADITWLLDYNEIHIIPQANPDGRKWAEQGYYWRKNTDRPGMCNFPYYGVDLNRNSSFLWDVCGNGCSSSDPCSIVYRGPTPRSEPETQAIEDYLRSIFPDQRGADLSDPAPEDAFGVFISLHSYGQLVVYPWDWTGSPAPNMEALRRLGRRMGYYNRYSVCNTSNCLYAVDGSTTDFAYGELGVAAYTFEVGTAFFQSCAYFENTILQKNLDSLLYAAKAARRPYQTPAGPDVVEQAAIGSWQLAVGRWQGDKVTGWQGDKVTDAPVTQSPNRPINQSTNLQSSNLQSPNLQYLIPNLQSPLPTPQSSIFNLQPSIFPGQPLHIQATADDTRSFSNGFGVEPSQNITAARVTVDAPSWAGGVPVALQPADGAFDSPVEQVTGVLDTTGWSPGRHMLFIEAQDASGAWGPPAALFVQVDEAGGLELRQEPPVAEASPGDTVTYTLTLTNTGSFTDTFSVFVKQTEWDVAVPEIAWTVTPGRRITIPVLVTVPVTATVGASHVTIVTVTSTTVLGRLQVATLETLVASASQGAGEPPPRRTFLPWVAQ